ncbi:MAG TPA: hypothetical protein DDY73_06460 [Coprobacter fastidiosus]|jgi:hypothetical protein|uniref:Uncharacterized protein n=3 Tax=Coprobacter fastidiosus TaxID=1099853 RepID=A0A495WEE3_9BACT|nr:hypothetical protein NSB1T_01150 [Coprobacter fastidiosus NSB1 = JCM 33896]RKT59145.1 hypothetical protein BC742_1294 [Coprobacter fastidiosus NSB1 = JCM 33896]BEG62923.1 hypothetical protein Cfast33896_18780 [Coprobacter fastidiosus]HBJ08632.1 hypothetical protein [Coprobacter fastidiosus]
MKINKFFPALFFGILFVFPACRETNFGDPVKQVSISRIDQMPNLPEPYKILDWRKKALDFDAYVFNFDTRICGNPVIWLDSAQRNIPQTTFGLYTAVNDSRQGPKNNNGEFHESLNSLAALLGGGLVGIDKTSQNGYNYVKMVQNYFNSDNGWNIVMNNTCPEVALLGGGYGRDWWYDVFPNVLYYAVCDVFPGVSGADSIQHVIAEQFCKADSVLNGNYDYSYFDYSQMKGMVNNIPLQQDAAGGHAYVLYAAYKKFGDPRYLQHAKSALEALLSQKESRFYEILLPMSAIVASRLNAEEGTQYDVKKILDWTFDGCQNPNGRYGWGVMAGRWGDYDVSGLQGSILDGGGYAFFMNSVKLTWPLVPMVKYEPQFATAIGKWMLNNVNACRLFYPGEIDDEHQWLPEMKGLTDNNIAYEGLRKTDCYGKESLKGIEPVALGDGPNWTPANPAESMFSLYSTSPVGILGAMVSETSESGILRINCNTTDFYSERPYPVYLYYNPHAENKVIGYYSEEKVDLFDIVTKKYIARGKSGSFEIELPALNASVIVELPSGMKLRSVDGRIVTKDNHVISYK